MLIDYHIHTNTSKDASQTVFECCQIAAEKGFKEICITNHHELISVDNGTYDYALRDEEINELFKQAKEAKKKFGINVKVGVELGYYEGREEELKIFAEKFPFDYIIGGIHFINGSPIATEEVFLDAGKEYVKEKYNEYFRLLKKAIEANFFDCVAHFELPRKETPNYEFNEYKDKAYECIKEMKKNNIGFELNTGGWRRYHNEAYPRKEILEMLKKAGIEKVTIGSDSHSTQELGYEIEKGLEILKNKGFNHICTFSKRKPSYHKICKK